MPALETTAQANRRYVLGTFALAALVLAVDQLTKFWAIRALGDGRQVPILGEFLSLRLLRNPGAALGIAYGYTWVLTIVVLVVIVVMLRLVRRIRSAAWTVALGLLLGGAIGNLLDRLFRQPAFGQGHVIDFIAYWNWFVGNVADIAIVAAAVLVVILSFAGVRVDGLREGTAGLQETGNPTALAESTDADS